jgi:hypothetical protein
MSATERNRIARLLALIRLLHDGRSHKPDDVSRSLEMVDQGWCVVGRRLDPGAAEAIFLANIRSVTIPKADA